MSYTRRSRYSPSPSPYDRYCPSVSPPRRRSMSRSRSRSRETSLENPGNNLYVTGLSSRVTRRDLEKFFSSEGKVEDIHLVRDPRTRESRGFGFVTMSTLAEANRCIKYLDHTVLEGRVITVEKARRSRGRTPTPGKYLGLKSSRGRHCSRSYSPYSSDEERSYSRSSYYHREQSYSPYYRSPVRRYSRYDSPVRRRKSYSRSYSPRPSKISRRSSSRSCSPVSSRGRCRRSYSPRNKRRSYRSRYDSYSPNRRSRRSYSRSYSPKPRRRSPSASYSPIPRRGRRYYSPIPRKRSLSSDSYSPSHRRERSYLPRFGRRSPSDSYSPNPKGRGRKYSRSITPPRRRRRSVRSKRYESPDSCCSLRSYSSRSAPSRSRSVSKSSGTASPSVLGYRSRH